MQLRQKLEGLGQVGEVPRWDIPGEIVPWPQLPPPYAALTSSRGVGLWYPESVCSLGALSPGREASSATCSLYSDLRPDFTQATLDTTRSLLPTDIAGSQVEGA